MPDLVNDKIHFVKTYQWEGLYINGTLVLQDSSLDVETVLDALFEGKDNFISEELEEYDEGFFPEKLEDLIGELGWDYIT